VDYITLCAVEDNRQLKNEEMKTKKEEKKETNKI
jgi:hypothetical protein